MRVMLGSVFVDPASIKAGRIAACGDEPDVDRVIEQVSQAYLKTPKRLRPSSVTIHLDPRTANEVAPTRGIEFHRPSRSLLVPRAAVPPAPVAGASADHSAWLHELAHVRMGARLPSGIVGQRLFAALEEGIADYHAASVSGTGAVGGVRDLDRPPRLPPGKWESLALPQLSFEPQRLGWGLAARLYKTEPRPGHLLYDLFACMERRLPENTADTPAALIEAWLRGCPARSRDAIRAALQGWLPRGLMGG